MLNVLTHSFPTRRSSDLLEGEWEKAEVQVLYSRLISDFFDVQAGLRYDFEPDPERAYGVIGLQGLAPQFFEVDSAIFVSNKGDVSVRSEEHTSELQSLMRTSYAVFCLKKNTQTN